MPTPSMNPGPPHARMRSRSIVALALMLAVVVLPVPGTAGAVEPDTPVEFLGGGWGHAIGMPQWGALGMAEEGGYRYPEILSYWYSGTGLQQMAAIAPAVPQTIRVGINYVDYGFEKQYRPFRWQEFVAVGGSVAVCLPGEDEGGCSQQAAPGETWRYSWIEQDGGYCEVTRNGSVVFTQDDDTVESCTVKLFWSDQPDTRVAFPGSDVGRTFARGHVEFLGPKTINGQTGFHLVAVLDMEEYLYGLAEVPASWHMQALKAQAVAARTFAAWKSQDGIRSDCSCHVVWDTFDQAYRGWHTLNEGNPTDGARWRKAVDDTAGEVVVYPAGSTSIAQTYYSSSTGGATQNISDEWGSDQSAYPYLVSRPDPWSARYGSDAPSEENTVRWSQTRSAAQVVEALTADCDASPTRTRIPFPGLTELVSIDITARYESGTPRVLAVTGIAGGRQETVELTHLASTCASRIGTLRSALGIRGSFLYEVRIGARAGVVEPVDPAVDLAAGLARTGFPGRTDVVYLVPEQHSPRAWAVAPAAAAEGAPVLVVGFDAIPEATRIEILRMGPTRIVVAGNATDVSGAVLNELAVLAPLAEVVRAGGKNKVRGAIQLAQEAFADGQGGTVYVAATKPFYAAALAAAAAVEEGAPLLLVPAARIPGRVEAELTRLDPDRIVLVGPRPTAAVETGLAAFAPVSRVTGSNRFKLGAAVADEVFGGSSDHAYVSVGKAWPQATMVATLAEEAPGPLLFVKADLIPAATRDELTGSAPATITVLTRPARLDPAVVAGLAGLIG